MYTLPTTDMHGINNSVEHAFKYCLNRLFVIVRTPTDMNLHFIALFLEWIPLFVCMGTELDSTYTLLLCVQMMTQRRMNLFLNKVKPLLAKKSLWSR